MDELTKEEEKEFHDFFYSHREEGFSGYYWLAKKSYLAGRRSQPAVEAIEQAHMAGQSDAGVDPSYSNAKEYANRMKGE